MPKGIPNKRYTPEFKQLVVETMRKEHISVREAMRRFEINNHGIIERWERIYLEEGPEGLAIERRGRKNSSRSAELSKTVEEDLIAENQRLRAENEYLEQPHKISTITGTSKPVTTVRRSNGSKRLV